MLKPILQLKNINKKISDFFSLKDISFELNKGEVHVLMGENGSGKSSLINIIWGAYSKDSGTIFLDGTPVEIHSPVDAKKLGISIIHQEPCLFEHFSVAENIYLDNKPYSNKTLKIINWGKMYADCQQLFKKLGFPLNSKTMVKNLGIAQKRLVEIAKACMSNARIIIMDEPTSSLTDSESALLFNIIRELKKSGVSIIYISHRLEDIQQIGDRVTVIREGRIIGTQSINSINTDSIIHMMTGIELKERYPKLNIKLGREVFSVANLQSDNILKGISLSLRRREIIGITGLVGSGRTKIANCIFGLDKIDTGEIRIENVPLDIKSPADAIRAGIGYVTEDRNAGGLFMYLNIPENMTATNLSKISNKFFIDRTKENSIAETLVAKLGIKTGVLNNKAAYLSSGNQQKLVLAKWIVSGAKIFLFDEPTRGIDIASKVDVYNLMNEMVIKGASIILISSDVDEVIGMCDRILILYDGKVSAVIPRNEATREKILFYATGGKQNA